MQNSKAMVGQLTQKFSYDYGEEPLAREIRLLLVKELGVIHFVNGQLQTLQQGARSIKQSYKFDPD